MRAFAQFMHRELGLAGDGEDVADICAGSDRYAMYRAGPVLSISVSSTLCPRGCPGLLLAGSHSQTERGLSAPATGTGPARLLPRMPLPPPTPTSRLFSSFHCSATTTSATSQPWQSCFCLNSIPQHLHSTFGKWHINNRRAHVLLSSVWEAKTTPHHT